MSRYQLDASQKARSIQKIITHISLLSFIVAQPSTYACELVIAALSKKLQWRRALQLLDLMEELEIPRTVVTYNAVISACARAREVGMAKSLLAKMQKAGIRPNEVSFNSVIGACASTARWKDALALLDQCYREPGVTPNIYIYTNAMRYVMLSGNLPSHTGSFQTFYLMISALFHGTELVPKVETHSEP